MIPNKKEVEALLEKYAPNDELLKLVKVHGEVVAEIAIWCAKNTPEQVNTEVLEAACLLHDVGSYVFIGAHNSSENFAKSYPAHAIFGAKILQDEGVDEKVWKAVETHVLMGLSKKEIEAMHFRLPAKDYFPDTIEARLVCYADRFHSKHPTFNSLESFSAKLRKELPSQADKMIEWSKEFGVPDIEAIAAKYNHPIR